MSKRRILILDDSPITLRMLIKALKAEGYEARGTADLGVFSQLLSSFEPHLILLDLSMPTVTGDSICRDLRRQFPGRRVPIAMISGLSDAELKARAEAAGADTYISKKEGFHAFVKDIHRLFREHPATGQSPAT